MWKVFALVACACSATPVSPPPPKVVPVVDAGVPATRTPPTMIAAGGHHTCLLARGAVWCWGSNDRGQLGDGTVAERPTPVRVVGMVDPVAIALGDEHTCALDARGAVWCWGRDHKADAIATKPARVGLPGPAIEIGAGHYHACARLANGEVACWGTDSHGELGGAGEDHRVPGITGATALRVGVTNSCVMRGERVECWGGHWMDGFFGAGHKAFQRTPKEVPTLAGSTEIAVAASHVCGRRGGAILCFGTPMDGRLGDPQAPCCQAMAAFVRGIEDATAIAAGFSRTCALRANGDVTCWGRDRAFREEAPTTFAGVGAVEIAAGHFHACARRSSGEVVCWGDGTRGQLGDGRSGRLDTPQQVIGVDDAVELASGFIHDCVRRANGAVACWGPGGDQSMAADVAALGRADRVTSGVYETCALRAGKVLCMQRGRKYAPGVVAMPAPVVALEHGGAGICGVTKDRRVACVAEMSDAHVIPGDLPKRKATYVAGFAGVDRLWVGSRVCAATAKQLTCTTAEERGWATPKPVTGVVGADVVSVAENCFVLRDGRVGCWAFADPKMVAGLGDATAIAAGMGHYCVLRRSGEVWCWGNDSHGQLGDGDHLFTRADEPRRVVGLAGAIEIGAGDVHTCARTAKGVWCWGSSEFGRLGAGRESTARTPVTVLGLN